MQVEVKDEVHQGLLMQLMESQGSDFWIGLNDIDREVNTAFKLNLFKAFWTIPK